jgi:hypothetical protein
MNERTIIMTTRKTPSGRMLSAAALAMVTLLGTGLAACSSDAEPRGSVQAADLGPIVEAHSHESDGQSVAQAALHDGMRTLWAQHMEWTYATIVAFAADAEALPATLERLLQNQADIGDAVKPFYGDEAGAALTKLLKAHINGAVPILTAAKAGDTAALNKSVVAWYRNANQIADFLARANPEWAKAEMRLMMKGHIDQTLAYATAHLQGRYADSIKAYGAAEAHMLEMADLLSSGVVAQFPDKFRK